MKRDTLSVTGSGVASGWLRLDATRLRRGQRLTLAAFALVAPNADVPKPRAAGCANPVAGCASHSFGHARGKGTSCRMWTAGGGRRQREQQRCARGDGGHGKALQDIILGRTLPPPNAPNCAAAPPAAAVAPGAAAFGELPPTTRPGPFKSAAVALLAAGLPNPNAGPALGAAAAPAAAAAAAGSGPPIAAKPGLDGWDGLVAGASAASAAAVEGSCGVVLAAAAAPGPGTPPGEDVGAGKPPKAAAAVGCAKQRGFNRLVTGSDPLASLARKRAVALDQAFLKGSARGAR